MTAAVDHPTGTRVARRRRPVRMSRILMHVVLVLIGLVFVFPFYWTIVMATSTSNEIFGVVPRFIPGTEFFANFGQVLASIPFGRAFLNSVVVTALTSFLQIALAALAGFTFAKYRFPGRDVLFAALLITMVIPTGAQLVPTYQIYADLGWIDTFLPLVVPNAVTAFAVFWVRQASVSAVQDDTIEAARMDGAGYLRVFWNVGVPALRPTLAGLAIFQVMWNWNDYLWPHLVLTSTENYTLQVALSQLKGAYGGRHGRRADRDHPARGAVPHLPPSGDGERRRRCRQVARAVRIGRVEVGRVALGTASFAFKDGSPEQSVAVVLAALEGGVRLVDAALAYARRGEQTAEAVVRRAVAAWGGVPPLIATKGGHRRDGDDFPIDGSPDALRRDCEASLAALGVPRIDLYQLHHVDPRVPIERSVETLAAMRAEGSIGEIGLSNVSRDQIIRAASVAPIAAVQNRFGIDRADDLPVVRHCESTGIAYLAYMPLGGSGALGDGRFDGIRAEANRLGISTERVALRHVLRHSPALVAVVGASRPESIADSALEQRACRG
jgi:cellobiose transport system permease protein